MTAKVGSIIEETFRRSALGWRETFLREETVRGAVTEILDMARRSFYLHRGATEYRHIDREAMTTPASESVSRVAAMGPAALTEALLAQSSEWGFPSDDVIRGGWILAAASAVADEVEEDGRYPTGTFVSAASLALALGFRDKRKTLFKYISPETGEC
jgi:hypothetical protein